MYMVTLAAAPADIQVIATNAHTRGYTLICYLWVELGKAQRLQHLSTLQGAMRRADQKARPHGLPTT